MRSWSDSEILDVRGGDIQDQDISKTHRAVLCCTSCNETARHSRGLEGDADQSPSNSRARVQGGPLTDCGMATRRTQTSGRGRRAWPQDQARGGSQIRVVDPKPGTRTRGHTHAHQHTITRSAPSARGRSSARTHARTRGHTHAQQHPGPITHRACYARLLDSTPEHTGAQRTQVIKAPRNDPMTQTIYTVFGFQEHRESWSSDRERMEERSCE